MFSQFMDNFTNQYTFAFNNIMMQYVTQTNIRIKVPKQIDLHLQLTVYF